MNVLEALDSGRRRVFDVHVEDPLVAETRIKDAYELSERKAYGIRNHARAQMQELRLGRLHTRVQYDLFSGVIRVERDKVIDVSARHLEAF
jgi:hypothetical protein